MLDNALRHGGGAVTISAVATEEAVELHVLDRGNGFPPEFLGRAFERFSQAEQSRSGHGAGLGLTIVETIAKAHGGHATATNRREGGADVAVCLPVALAEGSGGGPRARA